MSCWAPIVSSESILSPFFVFHVDPAKETKKTLQQQHWIRPNLTFDSGKVIGPSGKKGAFLENPFYQKESVYFSSAYLSLPETFMHASAHNWKRHVKENKKEKA